MEGKNNNKGLVILVCILSVLVLALGGFIIYDKVLSKADINNEGNLSPKETINNQNEEKKTNIIDNENNKVIEVDLSTTSGSYENVLSKLTINGKDVLNLIETKDIFVDSEIEYDSNSKLAVISIEEYSTGYINHHLYIFDSNGKLLKSIRTLNDSEFDYGYGYTGKFKLDSINSSIEYEVKLVYDETGCGYEYKGKCFNDLSKETINNLENKEDSITYEVNYLDSGLLSNPKKQNSTLLKNNSIFKSYLD